MLPNETNITEPRLYAEALLVSEHISTIYYVITAKQHIRGRLDLSMAVPID